jgi:hypothetical protein
MTVKQSERVIRILEVLKTKNCIKSYAIKGDEMSLVFPEWVEGGVDRVVETVMQPARPFGLRQNDRGWLVLLLPKERRNQVAEAMVTQLHKTLKQCAADF